MTTPGRGPGVEDRSDRWCVVGAGPAGLATAKNLGDADIPYDVVDRHDSPGGVWRYGEPGSTVYASTTMISSRRLIEFRGFAMPADWRDYPTHREALSYLVAYADHFRITPNLELGRGVASVRRCDDGWLVVLSDGTQRLYRGIVLATGH
ncbi:MAG: hypothetical protein EON52_07665, partial [Actinomycetales bacterium]